jgi:hypothetical protein
MENRNTVKTASDRLESLALKLVLKLRGKPRRGDFDGCRVALPRLNGRAVSRESVRDSLLVEFIDLEFGIEARNKKYGRVIDRWIEKHIDLIGEVSFCHTRESHEREGV